MEGIQPTWFSVPIMALQAYRLIKENDMNGEGKLGDVDMAVCWEILGWMAEGRRYGLAGTYLFPIFTLLSIKGQDYFAGLFL
jgi:hypothetical protein